MLRTYRKTATIQAEQFDGSDEMIEKYNLLYDAEPEGMLLPTKEGNMLMYEGDWIATGVNGEHWAIADDIFRKTYEKVTGTVNIVSDYSGREITFFRSRRVIKKPPDRWLRRWEFHMLQIIFVFAINFMVGVLLPQNTIFRFAVVLLSLYIALAY